MKGVEPVPVTVDRIQRAGCYVRDESEVGSVPDLARPGPAVRGREYVLVIRMDAEEVTGMPDECLYQAVLPDDGLACGFQTDVVYETFLVIEARGLLAGVQVHRTFEHSRAVIVRAALPVRLPDAVAAFTRLSVAGTVAEGVTVIARCVRAGALYARESVALDMCRALRAGSFLGNVQLGRGERVPAVLIDRSIELEVDHLLLRDSRPMDVIVAGREHKGLPLRILYLDFRRVRARIDIDEGD